MRAAAAAAFLILPLATPATAYPAAGPAAPGVPLREAVAAEQRDGYDRDQFRHWTDEDGDRCSTRTEVLFAEAVAEPEIGDRCRLTGGRWYSYFDDRYVDGSRGLDLDHLIPLAEAFDSGAHGWTPERGVVRVRSRCSGWSWPSQSAAMG